MKVKVSYLKYHTEEIEVEDELFTPLDTDISTPPNVDESHYERATKAIEKAMNMPFGAGDEEPDAYIIGVEASESGNTLLEW